MRQAVIYKCSQCGSKLTDSNFSLMLKAHGKQGGWRKRFCSFWCFRDWFACGGG